MCKTLLENIRLLHVGCMHDVQYVTQVQPNYVACCTKMLCVHQ